MLGPPKPRRLDEPVTVSLEDLVPQDNFYRHLEAALDLGFVRAWVQDRYAERGRPGIDPVVFFKLQLVMFFEGLRSERKLVATAGLHLAHRWYLGYALDEPLPDHSSLTRIRQRLGADVFERFFEKVVDLCQEAELVWGQELFVDATKVRANADVDSLVPRFSYEAKTHVGELFAADAGAVVAPAERALADDPPPSAALLRPPHPPERRPDEATKQPWKLLDERRLDPHRPASGSYRRTTDFRVSPTDPDATPMQTRNGTGLGYHDHYVVDGGKHRIILAALVTPADVMENVPMRDLLWRVRYDAEADAYRCPAGHPLRRDTAKYEKRVIVYRGDPATCNACPLKATCTESDRGRIVHRSFFAAYLEVVRAYHASEPYAKAMRKRQVWVEPLFAEAKDWHGLRRFRLRGLANVNIEGLLIAAGQNLKRFLAATGWGRRHAPCGSLVALPRRCPASGALFG